MRRRDFLMAVGALALPIPAMPKPVTFTMAIPGKFRYVERRTGLSAHQPNCGWVLDHIEPNGRHHWKLLPVQR